VVLLFASGDLVFGSLDDILGLGLVYLLGLDFGIIEGGRGLLNLLAVSITAAKGGETINCKGSSRT